MRISSADSSVAAGDICLRGNRSLLVRISVLYADSACAALFLGMGVVFVSGNILLSVLAYFYMMVTTLACSIAIPSRRTRAVPSFGIVVILSVATGVDIIFEIRKQIRDADKKFREVDNFFENISRFLGTDKRSLINGN